MVKCKKKEEKFHYTDIPRFTLLMWGHKNKTAETKIAYIEVTQQERGIPVCKKISTLHKGTYNTTHRKNVVHKNAGAQMFCNFSRKFLLSSLETFFCGNLENFGMLILGPCNVETVSKVAGLMVSKKFQGLHFLFSGSLIWWTAF